MFQTRFEVVVVLALAGLLMCYCVNSQCDGYADIVIAVPGSVDMHPIEFEAFENLIDFLYHLNVNPNKISVGLILYGATAIPISAPRPTFTSRRALNTRVSLLNQRGEHLWRLGSERDVAGAIHAVQKMLGETQTSRGARKIGIVFTYGPSELKDTVNIINAAVLAKNRGILMYALSANGTGSEFKYIGTDSCRLFSMDDFSTGLPTALPDLASSICSELDPSVSIRAGNCFPRRYPKVMPQHVLCDTETFALQPDPNNCAYFYRCEIRYGQPKRYHCAEGTIFDDRLGNCNTIINSPCYSEFSCRQRGPGLYPHPHDCAKFINCSPQNIPFVQNCPVGTMFDDVWDTCNETVYVDCLLPRV